MNKTGMTGCFTAALAAAFGLAACDALAWTVTKVSSDQPYSVSDTDLLQRNVSSVTTNLILYAENNTSGILESLTDGIMGPGYTAGSLYICSGTVTYTLDTVSQPAGYLITGLDTYSGWQDGGRNDQNYEVSFRKVGSGTFGNAITNTYTGVSLREARIRLTDLNLAGVDAIKFTFPTQENGGVGYKELDVFGMANAPTSTITGASSSTAYPVSNTDLLQTALGGTNDALAYYVEGNWTNAFSPVLIDGSFGSANKWLGTCGITGGALTYTLDMTNCPAGYTISAIDTYTGWNDTGRVNQNYWVCFRKVGASSFSDAIAVTYTGADKLTRVTVTNLNQTRVEAVRFTFPSQQNNGVGYKEFDVIGATPAYTNVTRRDSGSKTVVSNGTADVQITEGTGTPGNLTLEAATTVVNSLTQGATEDVATLDPAGQTLALGGLFLRSGAGGLAIGTGSNNGTLAGTQSPFIICNLSTNEITLRAAITNSAVAGSLLKTGNGALTLSSATNTSPGGTEVTAGTLRLAGSASLGSGPVSLSGAKLQMDGGTVSPAISNAWKLSFADSTLNQTAGSLSYGGYLQALNTALNLSGGTSYVGTDILLGWGGTNTTATISGSHTANWRVTRFSSGTVTVNLLSGGKLYTDRLYCSAGAVGSVFFDGGLLGVSSIAPTLNASDWLGVASGSLSLSVKDGGAVIDTDNGSVTLRRPLLRYGTSAGGLTKTGRNTLTLALTNLNNTACTYAGDTAVLGGTLKLGSAPAPLPTGTRMTVATDAVLDLNGVSQTVGELNGGGRVVNATSSNAVLTVGGNNASTNFSGQIEGAVSLVKAGSGTLTLSGANTFTNRTQILGGTLQLSPLPLAIVNAGFELPAMTTGECWGYLTSDGVTGGWRMNGAPSVNNGTGIARNGFPTNARWVTTSPQGFQIAYLQGTSYCFQTVTVQRAATYQLSFSAANRPTYIADNIEVLVDGASVATWPNSVFASNGVFMNVATNFYLTAGAHELRFQGTSPGGDTTTAIDDIRLVGYGASAPGTLSTNMAMEIAAGATLDLNGTDQPLAGLSGSGLVTNGTLSVSGIIAPGGTNTVGSLTLATATALNGTLLIDVAQNGTSDLLRVGGSLDLSGLTLQIQDVNQFKPSASYVIATCAPGSLTGRFAATNLGTKRNVSYNTASGQVLLICRGLLITIY